LDHYDRLSRLTLASASPRRRELLRYLTPRFNVVATQGEDELRWPPSALAARLPQFPLDHATHPTLLAWRKITAAQADGSAGLLLGADTIVVIDGDVLNKPRDAADAHGMLRRLAGRTHRVYTGLAGYDSATDTWHMALEAADVQMAPLSDAEIAAYVATGEPLDKAGAYGIQGLGGRLIEGVVGSYTCVVGLPLTTTYHLLTALGITGLADPAAAFERWLADQGSEPPPCTAP
jgi:septum formation protein